MIHMDRTLRGPERRVVEKALGYVIQNHQLLVFTHDDTPITVTGVQVPGGTIEQTESPEEAVVREVFEETGVAVRIINSLGTALYDAWPTKPELHKRHFFQLAPLQKVEVDSWGAGEMDRSDGGAPQRWTCYWMPIKHAHVLCAGMGAKLGELEL